jgi:hypothetical protein
MSFFFDRDSNTMLQVEEARNFSTIIKSLAKYTTLLNISVYLDRHVRLNIIGRK